MSLLDRSRLAVRRYGLRGAIGHAAKRVGSHVAVSESHLWYALDLAGERPRPRLAPELTLVLGVEADLPRLEDVQTIPSEELGARIDAGNDLWLVLERDRPLFSCWIFRGCTPVTAAPRGQLSLPTDTVCLEDSETAAAARGRGIAPAAWEGIADALAAEGKRWLITKVGIDNAPSRRAVEKAGFEAVALMQFTRIGPRVQSRIEPVVGARASPIVAHLAGALAAGEVLAAGAGPASAAH